MNRKERRAAAKSKDHRALCTLANLQEKEGKIADAVASYRQALEIDPSLYKVHNELARLLRVGRENIFAAGDHHNDVSMLDGKFAGMPSCPANAIPEVQNAVSNAGGYIAQKNCGAGVHEALLHFTNGVSCSGGL